jgi:predicted unusual protein kinase regulating ubiquinone biosynthesis (AarF/ABC1/UbiB family)
MKNLFKTLSNCLFLFHATWIILTELFLYLLFRNFDTFIDRITIKLSSINILYVKTFQAFALNNCLIDDSINNKLMKFTDTAPWTSSDIDPKTLFRLEDEHNLRFENGHEPINSGMISLVFLASNKLSREKIIIKMKRQNIEEKLEIAIEKLLFFVYLMSFIPFVSKYQIAEVIYKNISLIKHQINFEVEVQNMITMKNNCKNLKYVKIPIVYPEITQKFSNVIMMEYIEGLTINKVLKEDYEDFAKQVVKFGVVTTVIHGFSHGDLHAGNILFIKDDSDLTHKHKIGVLDFGITYETDKRFRDIFFGLLGDMFVSPSNDIAERLLNSGIIEPIEIIQNLPRLHYNNIIELLSKIIHDVVHSSKQATQLKMYKFLSAFNSYMKDNKLTELGLKPSDNFVKTQLSLAMSHGITLTLCKDDYMLVMDKVVNELFHTDMLKD